jgi:hypothetical protein
VAEQKLTGYANVIQTNEWLVGIASRFESKTLFNKYLLVSVVYQSVRKHPQAFMYHKALQNSNLIFFLFLADYVSRNA